MPHEQLLARIGSSYGSAETLEPIGPTDAPRARIALVEARPIGQGARQGAGVLVAEGLRVARTNEAADIILASPSALERAWVPVEVVEAMEPRRDALRIYDVEVLELHVKVWRRTRSDR